MGAGTEGARTPSRLGSLYRVSLVFWGAVASSFATCGSRVETSVAHFGGCGNFQVLFFVRHMEYEVSQSRSTSLRILALYRGPFVHDLPVQERKVPFPWPALLGGSTGPHLKHLSMAVNMGESW